MRLRSTKGRHRAPAQKKQSFYLENLMTDPTKDGETPMVALADGQET